MFGVTPFAQAPFSTLTVTILAEVSETVSTDDALSVIASFTAANFESAQVLDSLAGTMPIQYGRIDETGTVSDSPVSKVDFRVLVSELAAASEQLAALVDFVVNAAESARTIDVLKTNVDFIVRVSELAVAIDAVSVRLTWEIIDDSQSVNWQNVDASTDGGWSVVDISQPTSWVNVNTKG
jgi:hypothetical protein